jgi:O-acetyl-ADP-ribose deacetylase (regulator of RNase III)
MDLRIVEGDLLDQKVDVIVNAWNRNLFPWWLLLPQGVSRVIKRRAGLAPFRELARLPMIPLGQAVLTGAGNLPYKGIIHAAAINLLWRSSESSVRNSVHNALVIAREQNFRSIAFPLIGAGSGGGKAEAILEWMKDELERHDFDGSVILVKYNAKSSKSNITVRT